MSGSSASRMLYTVGSGGHEIFVWDTDLGYTVNRVKSHKDVVEVLTYIDHPVNMMATASLDKSIILYTLDSRGYQLTPVATLYGHKRGIERVGMSLLQLLFVSLCNWFEFGIHVVVAVVDLSLLLNSCCTRSGGTCC